MYGDDIEKIQQDCASLMVTATLAAFLTEAWWTCKILLASSWLLVGMDASPCCPTVLNAAVHLPVNTSKDENQC